MNYSELTQAIKDYTENTESTFVTNIPNFVRQAEERIFRDITIPELRRNVTGNVNAGNKYVARPDDFLATFSLAIINGTTYTYLLDKEVNFVREAYPDTTVQGLPQYYSIFDGDTAAGNGNFLLGPTPDLAYDLELHYYYHCVAFHPGILVRSYSGVRLLCAEIPLVESGPHHKVGAQKEADKTKFRDSIYQ